MSIAGNVILTINGQRVEEVTDATFASARGVGKTSMRDMMRLAYLRQRTAEAYDAWAATYGLPSFETLQALEMDRQLLGIGVAETIYERQPDGSMVPVRTERVPPHACGYGPGWRVTTDRTPKPTPKQYRLKRRAAGSKRRNKS